MDTPSKNPTIREFIHDAAILDFGNMSQEEIAAFLRDFLNTPPSLDVLFGPFPFGIPNSSGHKFEVVKSRRPFPGGKMFEIDFGKAELSALAHFLPSPFFGSPRPRDVEKIDAVRALSVQFLEQSRRVIQEINERREKEARLAQYEAEVREYEEDQRDYAEDKAPSMLVNVHPGITDIGERMAAAVDMAKALYRTMNAAPVHPFPPPTAEEQQAIKEAHEALLSARRINTATEVVLAIKESGGDGGEIDVTVGSQRFRVTAQPIPAELLEARQLSDGEPAAQN